MATLIIEDVPETFIRKVWNHVSFDSIVWLHWDWMDWCQYDEVIPSKDDIEAYKWLKQDNLISEEDFFNKLMQ